MCRDSAEVFKTSLLYAKFDVNTASAQWQNVSQSLTYRILHHQTIKYNVSHTLHVEEVAAHLDRKCLAVLSETSFLQLYTYITNEVRGYI